MDEKHLKFEMFIRYKEKILLFFQEHKNAKRITISFMIFVFIFYLFGYRAPANFPASRIVHIEEGLGLSEISGFLKKSKVIRSELLFESLVTLIAGDTGALHGDYFFDKKFSVFSVARKITKGEFGLTPVKILIHEGYTIYDIADAFEKKFSRFDSIAFLKSAREEEGYLFPDTYVFLPNIKQDQVISEMKSVFKKRVEEINEDIVAFGKPLKDIIIMASILEKEARTLESRRIIAGILWKRIEIDMPLQVDAVFPYINGKNTYQLTLEDLKVESPYNTYKYKGLPIGPIANPGLSSIKATVTPIESEYLFYLSDKGGKMHYAEDFEGHKKNRRLYLD